MGTEVAVTQLNFFDLLDPETRLVVQQEDKEFDQNMGDAGTSFLRACQNLKRIHEALRYKRPGFVDYCKTKGGLSERTANRMLNVARKFVDCTNIFSVSREALYLLADPDTPIEAVTEAVSRSESGETITHAVAKEIVATHQAPPTPPQVIPEPVLAAAEAIKTSPVIDEHIDRLNQGSSQTEPGPIEKLETEDYFTYLNEDEEERCPPPEVNPTHTREILTASGTDEHYTPPEIIQAVKDCFGGEIELDPASCHVANQIVKAQRIFTIQDDALLQTWIAKTVFMNPPYSEVNKFLTRLVHSYQGGRVTEAIALVKADTSTRWFQLIWQNASMVCFVDHRLKFYGSSDGNATFASAVAYFGSEVDKFYHAFVSFGPVVQVVNSSMFGE